MKKQRDIWKTFIFRDLAEPVALVLVDRVLHYATGKLRDQDLSVFPDGHQDSHPDEAYFNRDDYDDQSLQRSSSSAIPNRNTPRQERKSRS